MKMMQKAGSENFSWAIFLTVFLGHTLSYPQISQSKANKKRKKVLSSVLGVSQQKEPQMERKKKEQTKEERMTTHTILGTFLNFFSS